MNTGGRLRSGDIPDPSTRRCPPGCPLWAFAGAFSACCHTGASVQGDLYLSVGCEQPCSVSQTHSDSRKVCGSTWSVVTCPVGHTLPPWSLPGGGRRILSRGRDGSECARSLCRGTFTSGCACGGSGSAICSGAAAGGQATSFSSAVRVRLLLRVLQPRASAGSRDDASCPPGPLTALSHSSQQHADSLL